MRYIFTLVLFLIASVGWTHPEKNSTLTVIAYFDHTDGDHEHVYLPTEVGVSYHQHRFNGANIDPSEREVGHENHRRYPPVGNSNLARLRRQEQIQRDFGLVDRADQSLEDYNEGKDRADSESVQGAKGPQQASPPRVQRSAPQQASPPIRRQPVQEVHTESLVPNQEAPPVEQAGPSIVLSTSPQNGGQPQRFIDTSIPQVGDPPGTTEGNPIIGKNPDALLVASDTEDSSPTQNQPQQALGGTPQQTPRQTPSSVSQRVLITEYMLLDNGRRLPHWIEIYNPNTTAVNLRGYTFTYATRKFASYPWTYHQQSLQRFEIPARSAAILVSHNFWRGSGRVEGLEENQVYQLNLNKHVLKNGWVLQDANGYDVHRVGIAFRTDTQPNLGNPVVPAHAGKWIRQSWERYPSTDPTTPSYYGKWSDVGSPGFFELAPAAPTLQRKSVGMWGSLKKRK